MAQITKADLDEIFTQLDELDGRLRCLERVAIAQIFAADGVVRGYADDVARDVGRLMSEVPDVPPNAEIRQHLQRVKTEIEHLAAANRRADTAGC